MDKIASGNELFGFLEKKLTTFSQYLAITKQMIRPLADMKEKEMEALLSRRQQCITHIQDMDLMIGQLMKKMGRVNSIPDKIRERISRYLDKISAVARSIQPLDSELMVLVRVESNGIKNELLKHRQSRNAAMTYGGKANRLPRFLDTRS
ncbi:MAG: hypothetical protein V3S89_00860 [Desulfobacterales bacterium]